MSLIQLELVRIMEQRPEASRSWLTPRTQLTGAVVLLSVVALAFLVSRILSSSFKIEFFGEEILRVESLEREAHLPATAPLRDNLPPHPPPPFEGEAERGNVFVVVEQMPELIGGLESIQQRLRYPVIAKRAGIEGRVIVQFIVDQRGHVLEPKVVRGIGAGCDEEALRVVQETRFRPGFQRGKPVKVKLSLPITFRLR